MSDRSIPYLTLTEILNDFMALSLNDRRKHFANYMIAAKWTWKELVKQSIWSVKNKVVQLDYSTSPASILKPKDFSRFLNLSVRYNGKLKSLVFDDAMDIIPNIPSDACSKCGEPNTLGEYFSDMTVITNDVDIDGVLYTEKIFRKLLPGGTVVEITETPMKSFEDSESSEFTITTVKSEKHLCSLSVKPCGCLEQTDENKQMVSTYCGYLSLPCQSQVCSVDFIYAKARPGKIKIDDTRIYVKDPAATEFVLSYQTNGDCSGEELLIPEYAAETLMFGVDYRTKMFAPNLTSLEKREARTAWNASVAELDMFLNPIYADEFLAVQQTIAKWGSSQNEEMNEFLTYFNI